MMSIAPQIELRNKHKYFMKMMFARNKVRETVLYRLRFHVTGGKIWRNHAVMKNLPLYS